MRTACHRFSAATSTGLLKGVAQGGPSFRSLRPDQLAGVIDLPFSDGRPAGLIPYRRRSSRRPRLYWICVFRRRRRPLMTLSRRAAACERASAFGMSPGAQRFQPLIARWIRIFSADEAHVKIPLATGEDFNWTCPHCDRAVTITDQRLSQEAHILNIGNIDGRRTLYSTFIVCPNPDCRRFTLVVELCETKWNSASGDEIIVKGGYKNEWNLIPPSKAKSFPSYIPQAIRDDYREACLIQDLSPKASATLSRRCLQGILRDFWKVKAGRLVNEIEQIKDKVDHVTWDAIEAVRKIGNIGAHMEADINVIVDVDPNEAELLVGLVETLLREWYVETEERKARDGRHCRCGSRKNKTSQSIASMPPTPHHIENQKRRAVVKDGDHGPSPPNKACSTRSPCSTLRHRRARGWEGHSSLIFVDHFCNSATLLPFRCAEVAQLVEHSPEKAGVDSSILSLGTNFPLLTSFHHFPNCPRTAGRRLQSFDLGDLFSERQGSKGPLSVLRTPLALKSC